MNQDGQPDEWSGRTLKGMAPAAQKLEDETWDDESKIHYLSGFSPLEERWFREVPKVR